MEQLLLPIIKLRAILLSEKGVWWFFSSMQFDTYGVYCFQLTTLPFAVDCWHAIKLIEMIVLEDDRKKADPIDDPLFQFIFQVLNRF